MTCDLCNGTGYVMQDIGTATVPDYVEIPCRCNPAPTDADYDDSHVPGFLNPLGVPFPRVCSKVRCAHQS